MTRGCQVCTRNRIEKMRAMGFPVFASQTSPYDSKDRQRVIDLDVPVEIGGVRFRSGDLVAADQDSIVVIPLEVEAAVIQRAWGKVHDEDQVRNAIRAGMNATDAYGRFGVL